MGVVLNDVLSAKKNKNFDWFYQSTYLLITAIKEDDREALEYLLRLVNEYNQGNSSSKRNLKKYFETQMNEPGVIEAVAGYNNVSIFKLLVSAGIIINYKDKKVGTLLHEAARQGRTHIVKLLIENGVNVNYKDEKGQSPLHEAARQGHIDTVNFLIENGAKVNDKNKQSPLHEATSKGHTDVAKFLIKNGANVNAIDGAGYTPLHWAGYYGHESTFEALLEVKDIDLLAKDKNGDTAL